jgi:lipid II:glycine glycyltransferase (peptidoglycan interpeptide bridge formation enzyme)
MYEIKEIAAYLCSNGEIVYKFDTAYNKQMDFAMNELDKVLCKFAKKKPDIHYKNLSLDLIPFICENAEEIIKALDLIPIKENLE